MKKASSFYRWMPILAAILSILGILWTFHTIRALRASRSRLDRQAADLGKILAMESDLKRGEPWREQLARHHAAPMSDPVELLASFSATPIDPTLRMVPQDEREDGLRVFRMELEFREIPLATLGAWLNACEQLSPPWRAIRLRVDIPGGLPSGSARIEATLEGVQALPP